MSGAPPLVRMSIRRGRDPDAVRIPPCHPKYRGCSAGTATGRTYGWLSPPTCCLRDGGFTVGLEGNAGQAVGLGGPADAVAEVGVDLDLDRVRACLQVRSRVDGARGLVDRVDRVPVDGDGDDHV